jgi:transposase
MSEIASKLPEYEVVLDMNSVGKTTASQLISELGEINKFPKRSSLARFAGIEPPENQSGTYCRNSRKISKQGSPHLRKILFTIMLAIIQNKNPDDPIYQFISRKKAEGKPYKVRMIAGANKFLRMYYAKVKEIYDENLVFA